MAMGGASFSDTGTFPHCTTSTVRTADASIDKLHSTVYNLENCINVMSIITGFEELALRILGRSTARIPSRCTGRFVVPNH